jgi:hypothetical protein
VVIGLRNALSTANLGGSVRGSGRSGVGLETADLESVDISSPIRPDLRVPPSPPPIPSNARIDFVIAGAQKAGTTTLDALLRLHPGVAMPPWKELHYFDRNSNFPPGRPPDRDEYHRNWDWTRRDVVRGEVTPSYLALPVALERLAGYSPDLRIVCIFRNPVTRAYSAWNHWVQQGRERKSFHRALLAEDGRLAERARLGLDGFGGFGYRTLGQYASQLEALWRLVPRERTLVLRLESLTRDPKRTMESLTDFLGVARHDFGPMARKHARLKLGDMHPESARWLVERLEPDIARLESLLGWDCSDWRKPKGSKGLWAFGESVRHAAMPFSFVKPPLERLRVRIGAWRRERAARNR